MKILLKQMRLFFLLTFLILCSKAYSQGGWNINYTPSEIINSSLLGREVRFDFKRSSTDTLVNLKISKLDIRGLLYVEDTVELMVLGEKTSFIEKWKIYPDQGFIQDQYLESPGVSPVRIGRMILKKISDKRVYVDADLIQDGKSQTFELFLDKRLIKGILTKE